jgi:hypothetical protein
VCEQQSYYVRGGIRPPGPAGRDKQLTEARAAFAWLAEGSSRVQQQTLRDYTAAQENCRKGTHGRPRFRKKGESEGFTVAGKEAQVRKVNRKWSQVWVPKLGWVRLRRTRDIGDFKSYRVTKDRAGQWHVSFTSIPDPLPAPGNGKVIGIDRGVVITAALDDGRTLNCPQLSTREQARLRKAERRAARALKGSEAQQTERATVARLKAKETDRRRDFTEKTSTMLARGYDLIKFEQLNIRTMTASAKGTVEAPGTNVRAKAGLNRAILAQGWGLLRRRTEDKAPGRVVDVPVGGSRRSRARAKPSSAASTAASPATRTSMRPRTSRQDRASRGVPGPRPVPEGRQRRAGVVRASVNPNRHLLSWWVCRSWNLPPSLQAGEDVKGSPQRCRPRRRTARPRGGRPQGR